MAMDWKECCNRMMVKNIRSDGEMIKSLVKSSNNKMESANKLEMSQVTAASKLSLAYDSLRELLEALAIKKGYKIYNHECYTAFLKEVLKASEKGDDFDSIRKIRNAVNYYGKDISQEEAEETIQKIKQLRSSISEMLKK